MVFIYFDGVHGVGKTTLVNSLKMNGLKVIKLLNIDLPPKLKGTVFEQQLTRINFFKEMINNSVSNKDSLVLVDRSTISLRVYGEYFNSVGLISDDELMIILKGVDELDKVVPAGRKLLLEAPVNLVLNNIKFRGRSDFELNNDYVNGVINGFNKYKSLFNNVLRFNNYNQLRLLVKKELKEHY